MNRPSKNSLTLALLAVSLVLALTWLAIPNDTDAVDGTPVAESTEPAETLPEPQAAELVRVEVASGSPARTTVRGRVLDADGRPLGSALVGAIRSSRPTTTAADGRFELRVEPDRPLTLVVLAADHAPLVSEYTPDVEDLRLTRGGGLRGRITDAAGDGLPHATATLELSGSTPWPSELEFPAFFRPVTTGPDGAYAFANLMPGGYRVTASADGKQTARSSVAVVEDGVDTDVDPLALAVGFDLRGRVLGPDGAPVAGADVRALEGPNQPLYREHETTDAEGRFTLRGAPPGTLRLDVSRDGFQRFRRDDVDASRREELVVRLEGGLRITGTVIDALTGQPVERFGVSTYRIGDVDPTSLGSAEHQLSRQVDVLRDAARLAADVDAQARRLRLAAELEARLDRVAREARVRPTVRPAVMPPAEDHPGGRFEIAGLEEGFYSVGIASPEHPFTRVAPIAARRDVPPEDLRITLETGHIVRGVLVELPSARPVAGAHVDLVRVLPDSLEDQDHRKSLFPWVFGRPAPPGVTVMTEVTDTSGRFVFEQAEPGRCFVSIRDDRLADHDSATFWVESVVSELRVEVGARASLSGRVADAVGEVEVAVLGGHGTLRTVAADARGAYRFDGLQPGSYIVRAFPGPERGQVRRLRHSVFPRYYGAVDQETVPSVDVTLAPGEARVFDVALDLTPTGEVEGIVTINGLPGRGGRATLLPLRGKAPGSVGLTLSADLDDTGRFAVPDAPEGDYELRVYIDTGQELHRAQLSVTAGELTSIQEHLASGAISGRVITADATPPAELSGYVWVLPGATEAPADPYVYRQGARVHLVPVREGVFADAALTPGLAVLIVDLHGRERSSSSVKIPAGGTLNVVLRAGVRLR